MPDPVPPGERRSACMKEWGRVKGVGIGVLGVWFVVVARDANATGVAAGGFGVLRTRLCVAGCSHQRTREAGGCRGAGRLGCRGMYPRRFTRMMGSLATARLGSIS
jgi:hypothetical protein